MMARCATEHCADSARKCATGPCGLQLLAAATPQQKQQH
jgi:hypothetical protein|eukprot:COSAG01_NODE_508_length_16107_cov_120.001187_4_plen_39_part_00